MISGCFINAPLVRLQTDLLPLFLSNRLQPEIGLEGDLLWHASPDDFIDLARQLTDHGLCCTLHAPFHDLAPGGIEQQIVGLTRKKLQRAFDLIPVFHPQSIVCHLGYEAMKHADRFDQWLETSLATWRKLVDLAGAHGCFVMFENTYEQDCQAHHALLEALDSEYAGFCLDTGHLMSFARTGWQPWLEELGPWLGQLHLHDNDGSRDAHLAPGQGCFDFPALFQALCRLGKQPIITLEPHSEKDLWLSLDFLGTLPLTFCSSSSDNNV